MRNLGGSVITVRMTEEFWTWCYYSEDDCEEFGRQCYYSEDD